MNRALDPVRLACSLLTLLLVAVTLLASPARAESQINRTLLGTAIDGTDPVAYFTEGKPVAGLRDFTAEWRGATWRFASAANRDRFIAEPEKYAPQYGGYCAYAVSQGYTAKIDPEAWSVVDGKLYLNYSQNIRARWEQQRSRYIADADDKWPAISATLTQ
ncbi:YHS domain-containing (seleno)protein [Oceanibacterium hippocampi]|uniref:YHS domain protein n=1 Tax=Oceanibacterium hippocampi TaxID=745714 RepID=A0A1Y5S4B1_9PROT|nr:YHS domain-containing (seleno)protein [Oceanibacterium hippocampi]SLN32301.1 YHS domain protein [Oceanibacterium hippocampi]